MRPESPRDPHLHARPHFTPAMVHAGNCTAVLGGPAFTRGTCGAVEQAVLHRTRAQACSSAVTACEYRAMAPASAAADVHSFDEALAVSMPQDVHSLVGVSYAHWHADYSNAVIALVGI